MTEPTLLPTIVVYDKPPGYYLRRVLAAGFGAAAVAGGFIAHDRLTPGTPAAVQAPVEAAQPVIRARPLDDSLRPRFAN